MKKVCPYCLGLKAFCVVDMGGLLLFLKYTYEFDKTKKSWCSRHQYGSIENGHCCNSLFYNSPYECPAICPVCKGTGKYDWVNEMFVNAPKYERPTKEDFKRLRKHLLDDRRLSVYI